jgi:alkylation response protein AidB-like acyl-CoA dehydrogenase
VVDAADLKAGAISVNTLIDLTKRTAQIDFTGVPAKAVLTGEHVVAAIRDYRLLGALLTAAEAAGSAARCLAVIVDYLKTRKQFGKLIGSYQALKHPTVDIYCGVEDARSFCYHAASLLDADSLSHDAEIACRMAKVSAGQTMSYAGDRAVQFHGGIGFTWDCDSTLFIRRGQWSHQVFGDAIHHRKRLASLLLD